MLKKEYPKAITDLFGIPAKRLPGGYWMSNQDTVSEEWVRLVAKRLGVRYRGNKVATMQAMVEAVGKTWNPRTMASTLTASGGGGNISKPAFAALHSGLQGHPSVAAARAARVATALLLAERLGLEALAPPDVSDDQRVMRAIADRRGQPAFRKALLRAYKGRCALTGCDAEQALEAAHILKYEHGGGYKTSNGLLLRADIHTLFDLHLLTVDVDSGAVLLAPGLTRTTYQSELLGRTWSPAPGEDGPNLDALREHRRLCGL